MKLNICIYNASPFGPKIRMAKRLKRRLAIRLWTAANPSKLRTRMIMDETNSNDLHFLFGQLIFSIYDQMMLSEE